jgi:hypothetical protein
MLTRSKHRSSISTTKKNTPWHKAIADEKLMETTGINELGFSDNCLIYHMAAFQTALDDRHLELTV